MNKIIYMALTLISALSITGCSTAVTEDELAAVQEVENSNITMVPPTETTISQNILNGEIVTAFSDITRSREVTAINSSKLIAVGYNVAQSSKEIKKVFK